ncbi:TPA: response regulator transcription factor [Bacillus pseudomycoides]|nr:response regulator transcription factor [Bacillus pseudomycoides]
MIRILLVGDHRILTSAITQILKRYNMEISVCYSGEQALKILNTSKDKIDVFLYDFHIPRINGLELSIKTLNIKPKSKIMIMFNDEEIYPYFNSLVKAGVKGFINKNYTDSMIVASILLCLKGTVVFPEKLLDNIEFKEIDTESLLTNIELDIMKQVSAGKTNKEIAENLQMSSRNIEYHLSKIFKKLKVNSRYNAALKCKGLKLI